MPLLAALNHAISAASGETFCAERRSAAGGGCINRTEVLEGRGRRYFVKLNDAERLDMFAAEAAGLEEIIASRSVRAPHPVCTGQAAGRAFLVLEFLALGGHGSDALLGRQLAAMHRNTGKAFGWSRNNTIGSTPQINLQESDWSSFWREHRLRFQLALAAGHGASRRLRHDGEQLLDRLPVFFSDYRPVPSLLHGDLWGGNRGTLRDGTPVIFDPAVYYGDRETDLAMTELFGGFSDSFYAAYREAWPLDAGYTVRRDLYNLYHVLNHFNLFGGGYAAQAEGMIARLLTEAG